MASAWIPVEKAWQIASEDDPNEVFASEDDPNEVLSSEQEISDHHVSKSSREKIVE